MQVLPARSSKICKAPVAPAGAQELACGAAQSIAPPAGALAGYVEHVSSVAASLNFWFGCGPTPANGIDSETDAKSSGGGSLSQCSQIPVDCVLAAFGMNFRAC